MYCVQCGKEIPEKAVLCVHCGVATDKSKKISKANIVGAYILTIIIPAAGFLLMIYFLIEREIAHAIALMLLACAMLAMWSELGSGAGSLGMFG